MNARLGRTVPPVSRERKPLRGGKGRTLPGTKVEPPSNWVTGEEEGGGRPANEWAEQAEGTTAKRGNPGRKTATTASD